MPRSTKYYDALGVKPKASQDEIKKAFRAKAKRCHPDHHPGDEGKEAEFKEMSIAYSVLSDPDARKKYDRTGEAPQGENEMGRVYGLVFQLFAQVRQRMGDNIFYIDLVEEIKNILPVMIREATHAIHKLQKQNKDIDKLSRNLKHKDGEARSFLHISLAAEKHQNRMQICNHRRDIQLFRKARKLLDDYTFDHEKKEGWFQGTGTTAQYFTININQ